MIWKQDFSLQILNDMSKNSMSEHLGIEFTAFGEDFLEASMPVNAKTVQPFRILHGGASVVLAETLGSVASNLCNADPKNQSVVGLEINANHLKSVSEGKTVRGICRPIRIGRQIHVWQIEIYNENNEMTCISRLTVAIVSKKG